MPRTYTTARGEVVDFDAIMIKQQLSQAPMTIDVESRKSFIDAKEVRKKIEPSFIEAPSENPVSDVELEAELENTKAPSKKK